MIYNQLIIFFDLQKNVKRVSLTRDKLVTIALQLFGNLKKKGIII